MDRVDPNAKNNEKGEKGKWVGFEEENIWTVLKILAKINDAILLLDVFL